MTERLWTNNHDTLREALAPGVWWAADRAADRLIERGVVRVLDPDNTARILYKMFGDFESMSNGVAWDDQPEGYRSAWQARARAVIEALLR